MDKDLVFSIKDKIEAATGEECWIDLDGIESDAQFVNVIMQAINNAEIFLFMYSKSHSQIDDIENDWTIREINYAQSEGKRIVFVNIDGTPLTNWFKFMFGLKQQVDATSKENWNRLIADIRKWLQKDQSQEKKKTSSKKTQQSKKKKEIKRLNFDTHDTDIKQNSFRDIMTKLWENEWIRDVILIPIIIVTIMMVLVFIYFMVFA